MNKNEAAANATDSPNTVECYEKIKIFLLDMAQEGKVPCAQALALAKTLGVKGSIVGQAANDNGLKITRCQLGCFGSSKEREDGI